MNKQLLAGRIAQCGTYIMTVPYYGVQINLYLIQDEFFEIHYNQELNLIVQVKQAENTDLNKYLPHINIPFS